MLLNLLATERGSKNCSCFVNIIENFLLLHAKLKNILNTLHQILIRNGKSIKATIKNSFESLNLNRVVHFKN